MGRIIDQKLKNGCRVASEVVTSVTTSFGAVAKYNECFF